MFELFEAFDFSADISIDMGGNSSADGLMFSADINVDLDSDSSMGGLDAPGESAFDTSDRLAAIDSHPSNHPAPRPGSPSLSEATCDPASQLDQSNHVDADTGSDVREPVAEPHCTMAAQAEVSNAASNRYPRGTLLPEDFQRNGNYDPIHKCTVEGNVLSDLSYVDQQTTGSCSLMAQEQFVERWTGRSVSEAELIDLAWDQGVYGWFGGTNFAGLDLVLDAYDVPHRRFTSSSISQLEHLLKNGCDALVGVDAGNFYNDASCGPDAAHAIAVVGRGVDYWSGNTTGFYVTDSNCPGTARFVTVQDFEACWRGDLIAVPSSPKTNPAVLFA